MLSQEELVELGQYAILKAKELGASESEIYLISGENTTSDIQDNTIESSQSQSTSIIGIRAFRGKSSGAVALTTFNKDEVLESVTEAVKIANVAPADKGFHHLLNIRGNQTYSTVPGLYDSTINSFSEKELLDLGGIILDTAKSEDERVRIDGGMSLSQSTICVLNSYGIVQSVKFSSSSISCYANIIVSDTNIGTGGEFWIDRSVINLKDKAEKISKIAVEKAQKTLNSQKIDGASMPVIIHGRNVYSWLGQIIENGISARRLYEGDSYFSDRLGSQIMSAGISIIDNPLYPGGFSSIPFDDEGAPTSIQEIVNKDGILQKYITDSYTAYALDLPITGHAARGNPASKTTPSMHQMHVSKGEAGKLSDMIKDVQKGIYLESSLSQFGLQGSNISEKLNRAFYIKNGEIQYSIRDAMLGGNVEKLLNGINGVSSDLVIEFGRQTPHIMIDNIAISGVK